MNENRKLYDSLLLVVASRLDDFDFKGNRTNDSFESLQERLSDDAVVKRYRNDAVFRAKVTSMVAAISEITINEIERLRKERDELLTASELLLSRKRPGAKENDPRLILEIDCMNLEDVINRIKGAE